MPNFSTIALIACFAYAIESIFGFGGTIIFLGLSGFFFDFNSLLKLAMIVGLSSGLAVLIQSYKYASLKHLIKILIYTIPGALIGTYFISFFASDILIKIFALILIVYGCFNLFFPDIKFPQFLKNFFVILGGFIQGIYTIGGPFVLMGYKDNFSSKQELRSTMAGYFFIINSLRAIFFVFLGGSYLEIVKIYYPIALLVMLSVWLGYFIHKQIPEILFKKLIIIAITLIGVLILFTK
tara:strand:- start:563 stop:1276 length:714 start_codon:yes stop_codon:yes gene_type:complete